MLASRSTKKELLKSWCKFSDRVLINLSLYIEHLIKAVINYNFHFIHIELRGHCMLRQSLNLAFGVGLLSARKTWLEGFV